MVKNELNKDMNFEMSATLQFNILGMLNDTFFYYTNSHIRAPFFIKDDCIDILSAFRLYVKLNDFIFPAFKFEKADVYASQHSLTVDALISLGVNNFV